MGVESITQTETKWKIPKQQEKLFSEKFIIDLLASMNQVGGRNFYIMDYYRKKVIVDSPFSPILCGYSKEILDKEGFDFFKRILDTEEWLWLAKVNRASYSVFFDTPLKTRKKTVLSYELAFITADNNKIILHHKLLPYQLCANGNVWLSLCSVTTSGKKESKHSAFVNNQTGERHLFVDNKFKKNSAIILTTEERLILEWMIKGFTVERMALLLEISDTFLKQKRSKLYKKLDVSCATEAVHWAHLEGIF
jgi:DNA-binding CsgD family transcriptional regulator